MVPADNQQGNRDISPITTKDSILPTMGMSFEANSPSRDSRGKHSLCDTLISGCEAQSREPSHAVPDLTERAAS